MDTLIIVLLFAIPAVTVTYYFYDRIKSDRRLVDNTDYIAGLVAMLDGDDRLAFSKFREVVSVDSDNIDAYLRIGEILGRHGKRERALQVHQDLTMRHDLTKEQKMAVYRALTSDYLEMGDMGAAVKSLKVHQAVDPNDTWGMATLLELQEREEDWEGASTTMEKILKGRGEMSRKPLARFRAKMGDHLAADGQLHQARLMYKEAISLDERCAEAYLAIGDTYLTDGRVDDAVGAWKKMVSRTPENCAAALERLEKALFDMGRFGEIEDVCRLALKIDPANLEARMRLAAYFAKKSDFDAAEEQLLLALDNNPGSSLPVLELARLYLRSKKEDKIHQLIGLLEEREDTRPQSVAS